MNKQFFVMGGLPRSGSTLALNILNQNPTISVGPDSLLSHLINANRIFLRDNVANSQLPHKQHEQFGVEFCRAGAQSWIDNVSETDIWIDKDRFWFFQYPFNFKVFPQLKMIICIRDLRFVVNSFLKRLNNSVAVELRNDYYTDLNENLLQTQVDKILSQYYLLEALISLKELVDVNSKFQAQIYLLKYENLINNKQAELNSLYDFLGLERYEHDFMNVQNFQPHFDNIYQPFGDHNVRPQVPDTVDLHAEYLTPEIANYIVEKHKWYYNYFYPELIPNSY